MYDSLRGCAKEEEVKAEFCKFFKMKIFALRGIDHYTERVLFEFKYDRNFRNPENVARAFAQIMCYQDCHAGWRGRERKSCFYKLSPLFPNKAFHRITRSPYCRSHALPRVLRQHHPHAVDGLEDQP